MVDCSHALEGLQSDGDTVATAVDLEPPLLAMVQIPTLRIEPVIDRFLRPHGHSAAVPISATGHNSTNGE